MKEIVLQKGEVAGEPLAHDAEHKQGGGGRNVTGPAQLVEGKGHGGRDPSQVAQAPRLRVLGILLVFLSLRGATRPD